MIKKKKECEQTPDEMKREFMKKFGKLVAVAPVGMFMLMGPGASKAQASGVIAPPPPPP